jgi:hypothetical protein
MLALRARVPELRPLRCPHYLAAADGVRARVVRPNRFERCRSRKLLPRVERNAQVSSAQRREAVCRPFPMHATLPLLVRTDFPRLRRQRLQTLQVNLGYRCNQSCLHCHVNAGPQRTEAMDADTIDLVLRVVRASAIEALDLTGGAPELNPHFRRLVTAARRSGVRVIDRCNLTILFEPGQEGLGEFLAAEGVEVVASLPCYSLERVDRQRGEGVFDKSIAALQALNALGYAEPGSGLVLNLVYNPQGPSLPPSRPSSRRITGASCKATSASASTRSTRSPTCRSSASAAPWSRKGSSRATWTCSGAHRVDNEATVMCRSMVSVDWQGDLYDCDFNQMLVCRSG